MQIRYTELLARALLIGPSDYLPPQSRVAPEEPAHLHKSPPPTTSAPHTVEFLPGGDGFDSLSFQRELTVPRSAQSTVICATNFSSMICAAEQSLAVLFVIVGVSHPSVPRAHQLASSR